jgi:TolB-like protein
MTRENGRSRVVDNARACGATQEGRCKQDKLLTMSSRAHPVVENNTRGCAEMSGEAGEAQLGQPAGPTGSGDVFISYASQDMAVANKLVETLERHGFRCWIAPRNVKAGAQYADAIVRALTNAKALVLVLSEHAIASSHVSREIERAAAKKRPIIAWRVDAAPLTPAFEYFLSESQWVEAQTDKKGTAYSKLIDAIRDSERTAPIHPSAASPEAPAARFFATRPGARRKRILLMAALAVVAVALAALYVPKFWQAHHSPPEQAANATTSIVSDKSIAVLPFVNMSSDKEQEYFSDGLSEELLNLLTKIPQLQVVARTSSFYYKGKEVKLAEMARELHVAHLLEGSVRKSGSRVRITAQLIRAADGYHQWSETYDRTLNDVFAVQEEIAAAVVTQLQVTLLGAAPKVHKTSPEAYAEFLQARQLDRQYTHQGLEQSAALYQQALAIDPAYAAAWAGLADNYRNQVTEGFLNSDEGFPLARTATNRALAIDSDNALAHASLGWIALLYDGDLAAGARHFEHALALAPGDPDFMLGAAWLAQTLGRMDNAIDITAHANARDPMNPNGHLNACFTYFYARRLDEAIASCRTALALSPDLLSAQYPIGMALLLKGDRETALVAIQQEPSEPYRLTGLAMVYHALGRRAESDAALAELIRKYEKSWSAGIAGVLAFRGEADRAFESLDKAVAIHDTGVPTFPIQPESANLHDDPRWLPFLRKLGQTPELLAAIKFEVKLPK